MGVLLLVGGFRRELPHEASTSPQQRLGVTFHVGTDTRMQIVPLFLAPNGVEWQWLTTWPTCLYMTMLAQNTTATSHGMLQHQHNNNSCAPIHKQAHF